MKTIAIKIPDDCELDQLAIKRREWLYSLSQLPRKVWVIYCHPPKPASGCEQIFVHGDLDEALQRIAQHMQQRDTAPAIAGPRDVDADGREVAL